MVFRKKEKLNKLLHPTANLPNPSLETPTSSNGTAAPPPPTPGCVGAVPGRIGAVRERQDVPAGYLFDRVLPGGPTTSPPLMRRSSSAFEVSSKGEGEATPTSSRGAAAPSPLPLPPSPGRGGLVREREDVPVGHLFDRVLPGAPTTSPPRSRSGSTFELSSTGEGTPTSTSRATASSSPASSPGLGGAVYERERAPAFHLFDGMPPGVLTPPLSPGRVRSHSTATELERREQDMKQQEELRQREEELKQLEEELRQREEELKQLEEELTQREETVMRRESDVRQGHAKLSKWLKEAEQDWRDREIRVRQKEDEVRSEKLRLEVREEVMQREDDTKWEKLRSNVREEEEEEEASHTHGCFGVGIHWKHGRRAKTNNEESASPKEPLLHQQSNPTPTPSDITKPKVYPEGALDPYATPNLVESTSRSKNPWMEDQTWNKRQIGYIFDLGTALVLVFMIRPLLPTVYDRWVLSAFAAVWGLGSIGLPVGLFGTSRFEKNWSRHVGRFISLCFSLFVIYSIYALMLRVDGIPAPATSSLSPGADGQLPIDDGHWWKFGFIAIGVFVLIGHLWSWARGCCTGGDRDITPYDG